MKKLKLLLLEDVEFDAALVLRVLQRSGMGFEAVVATNRDEYAAAIKDHKFDLILADNSLPQFDAAGAIQLAREHGVEVPVILVTGTVSEEFAIKMMREGACDYILKDRLQRLPSAITRAIDRYGLEATQQMNLYNLIRAQALMKESERLARHGSWAFDIITNATNWSDGNYRILDYEVDEVAPSFENFLAKLHPEDLASVKETIAHAISDHNSRQFECRIVAKDGSHRMLTNRVYVVRDENHKAVRLHGFSADVTGQQ